MVWGGGGAPENDSPVRFSSISDKKNFAFTLSEVLITLGIVSVIAAMTLPSIIGNYKKKTYVTALQKFYTEFSQALQNSQADAGCGELECFGLSPNLTDSEWTNNAQSWLKKNFTVLRIIKIEQNKQRIRFHCLKGASCKSLLDISAYTSTTAKDVLVYTISGFKFEILYDGVSRFLIVLADINGDKGPNIAGRDLFQFFLTQDGKLYPMNGIAYMEYQGVTKRPSHIYWVDNPLYCGSLDKSKNPDSIQGRGCAARIIESGWKMNY